MTPLRGWTSISGWWWVNVRAPMVAAWTKLYRKLVERGETQPLPKLRSFDELKRLLDRQVWAPDGVKSLGDAAHSAEWLFANWGALTEDCDCDDFAELAATLVSHSGLAGEVYVCSLLWSAGGHAVTAMKIGDTWRWLDYGLPHAPARSFDELLVSITKYYQPKDRVLGWVLEPK